jgi:uncharacterized oxidoreductase
VASATAQTVDATALRAITSRLLVAVGTPQHIGDVVASVLVGANLAGHDSHGVLRVPKYVEAIVSGRIRAAAEPGILRESDATLSIDGQHGCGHYGAQKSMEWAIGKAKKAGVCAVSFSNLGHIGRLGHYAEQAAAAGCVGLIAYGKGRGDGALTVPFGGGEGRLGSNPIAAGVPTGGAVPFVLDIATSVVAEGKLQVARSKNQDLPEGYIVDKDGQPSTKTADFYDGGHLLPVGGHKGYGLSILACLLGALGGDFDAAVSGFSGTFMQVIDIDAFTPSDQFQRNARSFLDMLKETPSGPGFDQVQVPGDFEFQNRAQWTAEGISLPILIYKELRACAEELEVAFDL